MSSSEGNQNPTAGPTPGPWVWRGKDGGLYRKGKPPHAYGDPVLVPEYEYETGLDTVSPHLIRRSGNVTVVDLWSFERLPEYCPMCHRHRMLDRCVGWYCGAVKQYPGERVPEWGPGAVAGGMPVCRECYWGFYQERDV